MSGSTIIDKLVAMANVVDVHTGAAWGGLSTASYISAGGDFPGKIVVQYLAYFLGKHLPVEHLSRTNHFMRI